MENFDLKTILLILRNKFCKRVMNVVLVLPVVNKLLNLILTTLMS